MKRKKEEGPSSYSISFREAVHVPSGQNMGGDGRNLLVICDYVYLQKQQ